MSWDDTKVNGNQLTPDEWNAHVTDQKTRAVRGMSLVAQGIIYSNASQELMTDNTNLYWDSTNHKLGIGNNTPSRKITLVGDGEDGGAPTDGGNKTATLLISALAGNTDQGGSIEIGAGYGVYGQPYFLSIKGLLANNGVNTCGNLGIYTRWINTDTSLTLSLLVGYNGTLWIADNCSALSYTDRTPFFNGSAIEEISKIKSIDNKIDHTSLPIFAQKIQPNGDIERDLGAMISILVKATQELTDRIKKLESK